MGTMLQRYLLLWLVLLSAAAFYWPKFYRPEVPPDKKYDPFMATSRPAIAIDSPRLERLGITLKANWLQLLFAVTMLAIGSMLPAAEIRQVLGQWPKVLGGTATQYLTMPLLAYLVATLFRFDGMLFVGVMMVGCVPGAMASNVLTLNARGNVSYSVSLTTSATLLSPIMVPLTLSLFLSAVTDKKIEFPVGQVFLDLCWTVVVPIALGYLASRWIPFWRTIAGRVGSIIANLTILWIIAVVVALNRESLAALSWILPCALLAINVLGYLAGLAAARVMSLPAPMGRALTLEIGMQNAGLGAVLALKFFGEQAAMPAAMYTFGCMATGTLLASFWAARPAGSAD